MVGLTLRQIKSTIEDVLEKAFPNIPVHRTGPLKELKRPSFFVILDNPQSDDFLFVRERSMSIDIQFWPDDRYQNTLELLDVQDTLESTFGLNIAIGDRTIVINNGKATVLDKILHYPFSMQFFEDQPKPQEAPLMEELDYNG